MEGMQGGARQPHIQACEPPETLGLGPPEVAHVVVDEKADLAKRGRKALVLTVGRGT